MSRFACCRQADRTVFGSARKSSRQYNCLGDISSGLLNINFIGSTVSPGSHRHNSASSYFDIAPFGVARFVTPCTSLSRQRFGFHSYRCAHGPPHAISVEALVGTDTREGHRIGCRVILARRARRREERLPGDLQTIQNRQVAGQVLECVFPDETCHLIAGNCCAHLHKIAECSGWEHRCTSGQICQAFVVDVARSAVKCGCLTQRGWSPGCGGKRRRGCRRGCRRGRWRACSQREQKDRKDLYGVFHCSLLTRARRQSPN